MSEAKTQFQESAARPAIDESRALVERLHTGLTQHALYGIATRNASTTLREELGQIFDLSAHPRIGDLLDKLHELGEGQARHSLLTRSEAQSVEKDLYNLHSHVEQLTHDIYTDVLTGVYNRRYYQQTIEQLIDRGEKFSLLAFDIDHFKNVNDKYGHTAGDRVLQIFAKDLETNVAQGDIVVRIGGEEFCAIIFDADAKQAAHVAERLRETVEARPAREGAPNITVSIGVAQYIPGEDPKAFYERADTALYAAKAEGRNRVKIAADIPMAQAAAKPVVNKGPGL